MKHLLRLAAATLGIGIAIATPLTASASTQDRFSVSGSGAEAIFSDCFTVTNQVCTDVFMAVSSQITKADGSTSSETTLSIGITKYMVDSTGGLTFVSQAAGFGPALWTIDSRLTRASATASFQVITCGLDSCDDGTTATIAASWSGQGDLVHDVSNVHFSKGSLSGNFHNNGNVRGASASATLNGTDLGASLFAELLNVKDADVIICHMC